MHKNADKCIPRFAKILFLIAITSFAVSFFARKNVELAEWITSEIGYRVRRFLARLSSTFSFSLGEVLIALSPVIVIAVLILASKRDGARARIRFLSGFLAVLSLFYTGYVYTLGVGYHRERLEDMLGIEEQSVTAESLYSTASRLNRECIALLDEISFSESGSSVSDLSFSETSLAMLVGYDRLIEDNPELNMRNFDSVAKSVYFSEVMTSLDLLGVYTYFTGEANVNVHYPDYTTPFTVAHEMAHQRGIAREDEANFIAFLVCIRSESAYVRYSGYMNMLEYVASALYRTDKELYSRLVSEYDERTKGEINAYYRFYTENKNEALGRLSDKVNDTYLKAQGTGGVVSYGYVVRLAVAYYTNEQ